MIAEQLKKAVLQAAIQGKLTEQLPEDGNARDLIEDIHNENSRLVKEGKIKPEKPLPEISEDEIPFEIPENWCWVRIDELFTVARGGSPRPIQAYLTNRSDGINWIKIGDTAIGEKYLTTTKEKIKPEGLVKSRLVKPNDLLLTNSMSYGRPYILKTSGCIHDGWLVLSPKSIKINIEYIFYLLSSYFVQLSFANTVSGAVVKNLNSDKVRFVAVPIPPFSEQLRIVEKINTILPELESLSIDEIKLDSLQQSFTNQLKSSLLQAAVQGKLTEQLPSDGDARDLLEEIKAEKERLIKAGKIKPEKPLPDITEDEIPFDIPENWCWVRLGDVVDLIMGQSPEGNSVGRKGMEFHQGKIAFGEKTIQSSNLFCFAPKKIAEPDSILLCVRAPVGKVNMTNREICIGRGLAALKPFSSNMYYLFYLLLVFEDYYIKQSTGTTFKAISKEIIRHTVIPLPPLSEQKRIVQRLEELLPLCDTLE